MFLSICSLSKASETPIVDIYGAFLAILNLTPVSLLKYGVIIEAEPPPPTKYIIFLFKL